MAAELKRLRELERRYKVLKEEHELLKSHPVCLVSKAEIFAFIEANRQEHQVALMCRLYGVTRGGYYAWRTRQSSTRAVADAELATAIERIHRESRGIYGSPRIHRALSRNGLRVGRNGWRG